MIELPDTVRALPAIGERIRYLPATEEPLSADVFVIPGENAVYLYDAGCSEAARKLIDTLPQPRVFVISHFHRDHSGNLPFFPEDTVIVSGKTKQRLRLGTALPEDPYVINDGAELIVRRCPSVHENGSLILTVNRTWTLTGDLIYPRDSADYATAAAMLKTLRETESRYFIVSHRPDKVFPRGEFLRFAEKLVSDRRAREAGGAE